MTPRILVFIAAHGGDVQLGTFKAIHAQTAWPLGAKMVFDGDSKAPLHAAREEGMGRALQDPQITHLWFVDGDMLPEPDCLQRLIESDKDVVSGIYRMRYKRRIKDGSRVNTLAFGALADTITEADGTTQTRRVKTSVMAPSEGLATTGWVAGGCLLISRAAMQKLGKKAFRPKESDGEDLQFSFNCEKVGIGVWVNYGARAQHYHKVIVIPEALYAGSVVWHPGLLGASGVSPVFLEDGAGPTNTEIYMVRRGLTPERIAQAVKRLRKMERRSASIGGV